MDFISGLFSAVGYFFTSVLISMGIISAPASVPVLMPAEIISPAIIQVATTTEMAPIATSTVATTTAATTTKKKIEPAKAVPKKAATTTAAKKEVVVTPAPPTPAPVPIAKPEASLNDASKIARAALVNIACSSYYESLGKSWGSGVIIDPRGIIVTNAHVAQFFLIEKGVKGTDCIVRTGDPARPAYDAELIFISPQWMARHAQTFASPFGFVDGDFDYAFLAITKSLTDEPLPASFPYVPFGKDEVRVGERVAVAGYAAEFLEVDQIDAALSPTIVFSSVKSASSYSGARADLLELGGSEAAQAGASGGAIVNADGVLRGIIALASRQENTDDRTFGGISTDYIRRSYEKEEGKSLNVLLSLDLRIAIDAFSGRVDDLAGILIQNLGNMNMYHGYY